MADCGASGTAIDQAARAFLGGAAGSNQGQAAMSKQVANLFNHASAASATTAAAMPLSAPNQLMLPSAHAQMPAQMQNPSMDAAWNTTRNAPINANANPSAMPAMMHPQHAGFHPQMHAAAAMPQPNPMMLVQQQRQQQQMMQMQMMQMQQMQSMQHQQMMQHQQQQHQQQLQSQSQQASTKQAAPKAATLTAKQADEALDNWHEDLEVDFEHAFQTANAHKQHRLQNQKPHYEDGADIVQDEPDLGGASIEELAAAWQQAEQEYDNVLADQDQDLGNMWADANGEIDDALGSAGQYQFVHTSKLEELPKESVDWMAQGVKSFNEGNLKEAIRSFEMELQHHNPDNSLAWRMLGKCHAENDQDPEAIKCLEAAVDRDPYSTDALLALGVSYVNELQHEKALENMKAWITNNPKYAGLELAPDIYGAAPPVATTDVETTTSPATKAFEEVKSLLLRALDHDSTDADKIHEVLGVVYNVSKDFDSAIASFRSVLQQRPDDHQLWNKLGATLANGNRSEEALPAYHRAIQIKPKYARAWLNMAISHSNLQNFDQAARCYLQALSLNPRATHCWSYLRMALSSAERWDLLSLVFQQDLKGFQEHFDFVLYDHDAAPDGV